MDVDERADVMTDRMLARYISAMMDMNDDDGRHEKICEAAWLFYNVHTCYRAFCRQE